MLKLVLLVVCSLAIGRARKWSDCGRPLPAVTIYAFDIQPNPIVFPGKLRMSLVLNVHRRMDHVCIDTNVVMKSPISTGGNEIPCIDGDIESCSNIDGCNALDRIFSCSSHDFSQELCKLKEVFLSAALGNQYSCPINPGPVTIQNETITLHDNPSGIIGIIADKDFTMTIKIKEDPQSQDYVGCLTFDFGIRRKQDPGFLFG